MTHRKLRVYGTALSGDGYPNAQQTLVILKNAGWEIRDHAHWLPPDIHLWKIAKGTAKQRLSTITHLALSSLKQALLIAVDKDRSIPIYIPYPSLFTLWWISFIPQRWRPFCIIDAYISIWDSMFRDRTRSNKHSLLSSLVKAVEARALHTARLILSDTTQNAKQLSTDFKLNPNKIKSIPLAINEEYLLKIPSTTPSEKLKIIFSGTMIPLHGIKIILDTALSLKDDTSIEFTLIGSGQEDHQAEAIINEHNPSNLTWLRNWHNHEMLCKELSNADICLGVFGGEGKASRVLPFKIYMALAAGKPVITQEQLSRPENTPEPPCIYIKPDSKQLTDTLIHLNENRHLLVNIGKNSREAYKKNLSNSSVLFAWKSIIEQIYSPVDK